MPLSVISKFMLLLSIPVCAGGSYLSNVHAIPHGVYDATGDSYGRIALFHGCLRLAPLMPRRYDVCSAGALLRSLRVR